MHTINGILVHQSPEVILVLGASPIQPQHVYQMCFSHANVVLAEADFIKAKQQRMKVPYDAVSIILKCTHFEGHNKLF